MGLTFDLPAERVRGQARRVASLRHLAASLKRLECGAPLGPDALRALREAVAPPRDLSDLSPGGGDGCSGLLELQLDSLPRQHCPAQVLEELCRFTGLQELTVAYNAGRTLTHAAPLGALTNLRRLVSFFRFVFGREKGVLTLGNVYSSMV